MNVAFSPESKIDIEEIGDEIAKRNPQRAASYVTEIRDACLRLTDYPDRFPVVARLGDDYRRFVHGVYSIFYLVNDDHVRIVRVIHGARLIAVDLFL